MSGGIIVTASVVGALALFETVLPWAFAALRKWRREQARVSNRTFAVSATGVVKDEPLTSATVPAASSLRGAVTVDPLAGATRRGAAGTVGGPDANRLWEEARGMTHRFRPDWEKDQEYLSKIYAAARPSFWAIGGIMSRGMSR